MKKLVILFFVSLLFAMISGCSKTENSTGELNTPGVTSISGKLEGWTHGTGKTIVMGQYNGPNSTDVIGSGSIGSDGSFTVNLLAAPMEFLLDSLTSGDFDCSGKMTSTVSGVMVFGTGGALILNGSTLFGYAQCVNRDWRAERIYIPQMNDEVMEVVYFSKATTLAGSQTCPQSFDGTTETQVTRNVPDLQVSAGWNLVYDKVTARTDSTCTFNLSKTSPGTLKWYYKTTN